ncbi:MAG: SCO family protein [Lewinellaceae bacterium]|nr:SCO family protein [Lewinella sp.]MCB9280227.1 SCO family protein [Lewinellaceae bacterium]
MTFRSFTALAGMALMIWACNSGPEALPVLGQHDIDPDTGDTISIHQIPDFSFVNQDSQTVSNGTYAGKAYVADFFFVSCPTICPKVAQQMLRLYKKYEDNDQFFLLSHTIDPKHDTIPRLKKYAEGLGVMAPKWDFVTGDKKAIYDIAADYMSIASEDPDAPGGFNHSGYLILVDKNRHIRSFCNGTQPEDVDRFMKDIDWLLAHGG